MACSGSSQAAKGTGRFPCLRRLNRSSSAAATIRPSTTSAAAGSWNTALIPRTATMASTSVGWEGWRPPLTPQRLVADNAGFTATPQPAIPSSIASPLAARRAAAMCGTCAMSLRTPYYLIDERRLLGNLEIVRRVRQESGAKAVLALKCFSTWCVFDLISEHLDGSTSSSLFEARLGRERIGKEVHAYSVAWSADELAEVAGLADKVIFNSVQQLRTHEAAVRGLPLGLRVNPGVSYSHFDLADPARRHSRLGVTDDDELRAVASNLSGLMFHFNCENGDH